MVAVLMGPETAVVDAIFFWVVLKGLPVCGSGHLVINTLNATIALAPRLAWEFRHMRFSSPLWKAVVNRRLHYDPARDLRGWMFQQYPMQQELCTFRLRAAS